MGSGVLTDSLPIFCMKKEKTCGTCSYRHKGLCTKNKLCSRWLYYKASCLWCDHLLDCAKLGKTVDDHFICPNFSKASYKYTGEIEELLAEDTAEGYNPVDLVEKIISNGYDSSAFELIDDSDIPKPRNMLEAITGEQFMNIRLYPRQYSMFSLFLNTMCPWCSNMELLRNHEVDCDLELLEEQTVSYHNGICPRCKRSRYDAFKAKMVYPYNQLVATVGQRSGKSASVSMLSSAILMCYLKLPNPVQYYGLLGNSILHGTFVGLRYSDAYDNLWEPMYNILTSAPWFKNYHQFLTDEGQRLGVELFNLKDSFVSYTHKNITFYPAGPDKRKLRGRCLPGYTLINTNCGLRRLDSSLTGLTTYKGVYPRTIIDQVKQPYTKKVLRATLANGLTLDASFDHRVLSLKQNGKLTWVNQENLTGKYVLCQLKGDFPKELTLDHGIQVHTNMFIECANFIADGKTFTRQGVCEVLGTSLDGAQRVFHPMLKAKVLNVKQHRDHMGYSLPAEYTINSKFKLSDWNKPAPGKINTNRNKVSLPEKMTVELARIVGYLLADGDISYSGESVHFITTSQDKKNDFKRCFTKVFGCKAHERLEEFGYGPTGNDPCYYIEFSYKSIKQLFQYLGLTSSVATTKTIPWSIFQSPRDCVLACVSTMISCDGGIIDRSDHIGVYYSSTSEELTKGLQLLVMRLGYVCSRRGGYLKIERNDSVRFLLEYTGIQKRKNKKEPKIYNSRSKKSWEKYKVPFTEQYIRSSINKFFDVPNNKFTNKNIVFSKVVSVEDLGEMEVYDLSVDSNDSIFPANNVLVHNTRAVASIDELGWFSGGEESAKYNPDEIYTALDNSLMTIDASSRKLLPVYPDTPFAYGLYISSPRSKLDKSMRMYKQSMGSTRLYGIKLPTWEFNPNISREALAEKFREDPISAERDFGANPPYSVSPYISSPANLIPIFTKVPNYVLLEKMILTKDVLGTKLMYPRIHFRKIHSYPSVLALDCGYSSNSYAMALMTKVNDKVIVSGLLEITPKPYNLSFPRIYSQTISKIIQFFNVKVVACDRWQSINIVQSVGDDHNILGLTYSVTGEDFDGLKQDVFDENIVFPRLESPADDLIELDQDVEILIKGKPVNHLFLQFLMSSDTGRTVIKGDGFTDDLLRAVCLGRAIICDPEYEELLSGAGSESSGIVNLEDMICVTSKGSPGITSATDLGVVARR